MKISPSYNNYEKKNRADPNQQSYELMISEHGGTPLTRNVDSALDGANPNFGDSPIPGQDPITSKKQSQKIKKLREKLKRRL